MSDCALFGARRFDRRQCGRAETRKRGSSVATMKTRWAPGFLIVLFCPWVSLGPGMLWGQETRSPAKIPSLPVLTCISDVRQLSANKAELGFPARILGVVTYYGGGARLFIQDSTGGIYVQATGNNLSLTLGDRVEVAGVTGHGWFLNQIEKPTIRVLGRGRLPEPLHPRLEELNLGREDPSG